MMKKVAYLCATELAHAMRKILVLRILLQIFRYM